MDIVSPHLVRFPFLAKLSALPSRRHPVFFDRLSRETAEVRLYLPAGRHLKKVPEGRTLDGPGVSGSTSYEIASERGRETLVVRRSITFSRREIPPSDYGALRQSLASLLEEESRALTLQPAGS